MIAYLKGQLQSLSGQSAIILVGGVGYEVLLTPQLIARLTIGDEIELYIAEHIKEDHYSLLGFATPVERSIYFQLTSVSGVGPKAALAVLATHQSAEVEKAIIDGQVEVFSAVPGVGKKTAQRIILELKGKLTEPQVVSSSTSDPAYQALLSLGYQGSQAKSMLVNISADLPTEARVKAALKGGGRD